jgi:hypothetical protein
MKTQTSLLSLVAVLVYLNPTSADAGCSDIWEDLICTPYGRINPICVPVELPLGKKLLSCHVTANEDEYAVGANVYASRGSDCSDGADYCVFGSDVNGDDFCCPIAGDEWTIIEVYGSDYSDEISLFRQAYLSTRWTTYDHPIKGRVYGLGEDDLIFGSKESEGYYEQDYLHGDGGEDTIHGEEGNDNITGDSNIDTIFGDQGDDTIFGGADDDTIYGDQGDDIIFGDADDDTIFGGSGVDDISGGDGDNIIDGGDDPDTIVTGTGNDRVAGGAGNDTITTNGGDDTVCGDDDDDSIFSGPGEDNVWGGDGSDLVYAGTETDNCHAEEKHECETEIPLPPMRPYLCP